MIATVVNVFCLLFAVILALIAMANVFNTVTNSLILRRREFAVMKSVGLSNRQFRAMVAEECVAWCIRGLVPGVLLSLLVSFLLWQVISGSMTGLPFTLPWNYVALAAAMFFCILPILSYVGAPEIIGNWLQCLLPGGAIGLNNSLMYAMTELDFMHLGGLSVWNVHLMFIVAAIWIPVLLIGTVWSYCRRSM